MSQVSLCTCSALRTSSSTKPYTPCTDSCCHCCYESCKPRNTSLLWFVDLQGSLRPLWWAQFRVYVDGWVTVRVVAGQQSHLVTLSSSANPRTLLSCPGWWELYTSGIFLIWTACQTAETVIPIGCQSVSLKLLGDVQACPMACRIHDCDARQIWATAKDSRIVRLGVVRGKSHSCHSDTSKMC